MSQENVEVVRRGLEWLLDTGEVLWDTFDEQVEVHDHDIMDAGEYRGHAAFRRWLFEDWGAVWSEWSITPEKFIDADDCVVVIAHVKAKGSSSGAEVNRQDGLVYKLRDGKVVRLDYYNSKQQALKAVGLAE